MNEKANYLRGDNVLIYRIILLIIYCIFTIVFVVLTNGSASSLYEQLLLQVGSIAFDTAPKQVQP